MKGKIKAAIAVCTLAAVAVGVSVPIAASKGLLSSGNDEKYSVGATAVRTDSPIKGKTIIFLGSSVTFGSASKGESFADYLAKVDGVNAMKYAVSGTTLADTSEDSYISRMKNIDTSVHADAFVCQLSTNDATKKIPLGEISDSREPDAFDTQTVAGSIEYVICYAQRVWKCPVIFYTGTRYDSQEYADMVALLGEIQKKWDIGIIDLWNNEQMNAVGKSDYRLYMANSIHPTRAGYRDWWLPVFEEYLYGHLA
ncbi:MAG: SGNH/GDSL hydrolase family protein [Clostridiales bacterium]|nr:SGNH/GDSL hydrolase family protein [Clostridiales bacterium]